MGLGTVTLAFWTRWCCIIDLGIAPAPICVSRTYSITPELIYKGLLECRMNVVSLDLQVEDCERAPVMQTNRT